MEGKKDSREKRLEEIYKEIKEKRFQNAFEEILKTFQDDIYRYCYFRLERDEALASDVAQNIFLATWKGLPRFRNERVKSFRGWLFTIAANKVSDAKIMRFKEKERYGGEPNEGEKPSPGSKQSRQKILLSDLRRALMKLEKEDRELLRLAAERYSAKEIAEFLEEDISPHVVRVRIHRARKRLRKKLDDE